MLSQTDLSEFFSERAETYLFFSRIIFKELTQEAVDELAQAEFPEDNGNESLDQGYRLISRYFKFKSNDPQTELACEYARIFLASGMSSKSTDVAVPYESVFTSEENLMMQDSRDDVYHRYAQDGFKVDPKLHEPEDHLALELEYMASMSTQAEKLLQDKAWDALRNNLERQQEFINLHLLNWVPDLAETARRYAQLSFYVGMLLVIQGYLEEDREALADIKDSIKEQVVLDDIKDTLCDQAAPSDTKDANEDKFATCEV